MLPPNDMARLIPSEMTAMYIGPNVVFSSDDVREPKLFAVSIMSMPDDIPTIRPIISGVFLSIFVYNPKNTAGKICTMSIPPSNCRDIA